MAGSENTGAAASASYQPNASAGIASGSVQVANQGVGSHISQVSMGRSMKVYPLVDSDLALLHTLGMVATSAFSITGAALSFAATLYIERQVSPEATPAGELLMAVGPSAALGIAIVSGIVGIIAIGRRGTTLDRIKDESEEIELKGGPAQLRSG